MTNSVECDHCGEEIGEDEASIYIYEDLFDLFPAIYHGKCVKIEFVNLEEIVK